MHLPTRRRALAGRLAELRTFDDADLPAAHRVDAEVLDVRLRDRLLEIADDGEHTWNPLVANPGSALYLLIARDFAPLDERLRNAGGRLAQIPEQLEASRSALQNMPRVHVETAIGQFGGTLGLLDDIGRELTGVRPEIRTSVAPALDAAREALTTHVGWLTGAARVGATAIRDAGANDSRASSRSCSTSRCHLSRCCKPPPTNSRATEEQIAEVAGQLGGTPKEVLDRLAV